MVQYIDKDAVINKIKEKRDAALMRQHNLEKIGQETVVNELIAFNLDTILSFIDTLDVKEVDLEKEIQSWVEDNSVNGYYREDVYETAKHFFELGLNARKED